MLKSSFYSRKDHKMLEQVSDIAQQMDLPKKYGILMDNIPELYKDYTLGFTAFVARVEDLQSVIKDLIALDDPEDPYDQHRVFRNNNLFEDELLPEERELIIKEVRAGRPDLFDEPNPFW